jgi:hypothetical protein
MADEAHITVLDAMYQAADGQDVAISPLVARLIMANHESYTAVVNSQVEHLERTIADLRAELAAIRYRVEELFVGPWTPTESAVMQAVFYPDAGLMGRLRETEPDQ